MNTNMNTPKELTKVNIYGGTKPHSTSLLERSEYTLGLVNSWISNADTKVGISSGIFSVIVAIIVFFGENTLKDRNKTGEINLPIYRWFIILFVLAGFSFLVSEFFHVLAISPSFSAEKKSKCNNTEPQFSIFYNEIGSFKSAEKYISVARNTSEMSFEDEVLKEIYYNSQICAKKMRRFKIGVWTGWASISLIIICCVLYYCAFTCHQ